MRAAIGVIWAGGEKGSNVPSILCLPTNHLVIQEHVHLGREMWNRCMYVKEWFK